MPPFDYASVKPDDLKMTREPRKSKVRVEHVPSGTVAEDPVAPGSLAEVRFRRHTNLPKENRQPNMEGYIETTTDEDGTIWIILEKTDDSDAKNEYLIELAGDEAALKASFEGDFGAEGKPKPQSSAATQAAADQKKVDVAKEDAANQANDEKPPAEAPAPAAAEDPSAVPSDGDPAPETPTEPAVKEELDDLLAGLP